MKNKNILWLYLFLFASMADFALIIKGLDEARIYSKPLIVTSLIIYFYLITKPISWTLLSKAMMGALIFSLIGDVLLLWENLFIYGLGAFLLAQVCYIIAFKISQRNPNRIFNVNFIRTFFFNLPIYIAAAFVYFLIHNNLGPLKIPVVIYIIIIVSMVTTARERFKRVNPDSFWQVFVGACFFFVSDGMIAINKFYFEFPEAGIMIMGTYVIAQLLIVMGIRSYILRPE
ncbi:lysoplasmalogenase [Algoriphagus sp. NF]|uniref:Lysoplasmalogenase n=1 Tax=Algoriphagus formosus TaxID=2007308 RepID=A0A4R5V3B2_9BACT|nr:MULTISPECIES: lysoplasmalogenase [Algoriphagus]MDE0560467.1 lysoplasmalogenase [Algoriphagus sp. NF]TDK45985.1 lysoplasmalogenase [Algoriphagus aquimaris]